MTKIMTADLVFEQIKSGRLSLKDTFKVSEDAWRRGGVKSGSSTMFLDVNSNVAIEDLLRGVIIQSGKMRQDGRIQTIKSAPMIWPV